jgi:NAD+ synthase
MANLRSRIRMSNLYVFASNKKYLVAGTGNKVEDFGVGFYTKYGDGGVDISPIADLLKSEVFKLAKHLGIISSIQNAKPTDGLWNDDRTDEDQLGATYDELEWAMTYNEVKSSKNLSKRQLEVLDIYNKHHLVNQHKMLPIPVCKIPKDL